MHACLTLVAVYRASASTASLQHHLIICPTGVNTRTCIGSDVSDHMAMATRCHRVYRDRLVEVIMVLAGVDGLCRGLRSLAHAIVLLLLLLRHLSLVLKVHMLSLVLGLHKLCSWL